MIYSESFLSQIKSRVDIVDLISSYISVQKKARDYWACCPFHHEKTPSFHIRADHQFYKCYGCSKYGNIFTFLMEYEKMGFGEAVETLAAKAGLELPERSEDKEYQARKALLDKIYAINKETARFYHRNLALKEGAKGLEYYRMRGIDWATIQVFGLGYSADFDTLPNYLNEIGYDNATLLKAGVIGVTENKQAYDFFGNRIIIPIINASGKVIGFTGRALEAKPDFAKYKNTGATAAFDKRKNLFGVNLLKKYVHSGVRSVILVEGHMDLIALYQAGIKNAVASMGTSLTIEQCRELKRYADVVYVSFDGDAAGQNATLRGLDMLKEQGLDVKVVCLTDGADPDDYIKKNGRAGYEKLMDASLPLIDFKLLKVKQKYALDSYDDRTKYAEEAVSVLKDLTELESGVYVDEVSKISGVNKDVLASRLQENYYAEPVRKKPAPPGKADDANVIAARFILSSILYAKNYVDVTEMDRSLFTDENHQKIYDYIYECIKTASQPKISDVFDILENNDESGKIIDSIEKVNVASQADFYAECVKKLKKDYINRELTDLVNELKTVTGEARKTELKERIQYFTKLQK